MLVFALLSVSFAQMSVPSMPSMSVPDLPLPTLLPMPNIGFPGLDNYFNPNLTAPCFASLTTSILKLVIDCMNVTNVLSFAPNPSTNGLLNSFLGSPGFLSAFCSTTCSASIASFNQTVTASCGNSTLLAKNSTNLINTTGVDAADIVSTLYFVQAVGCLKDNGSFCLVDQYKYLAKKNTTFTLPNLEVLALTDKNFSCSTCLQSELKTAKSQTLFVGYAQVRPFIGSITNMTNATCVGKTNRPVQQSAGYVVSTSHWVLALSLIPLFL